MAYLIAKTKLISHLLALHLKVPEVLWGQMQSMLGTKRADCTFLCGSVTCWASQGTILMKGSQAEPQGGVKKKKKPESQRHLQTSLWSVDRAKPLCLIRHREDLKLLPAYVNKQGRSMCPYTFMKILSLEIFFFFFFKHTLINMGSSTGTFAYMRELI